MKILVRWIGYPKTEIEIFGLERESLLGPLKHECTTRSLEITQYETTFKPRLNVAVFPTGGGIRLVWSFGNSRDYIQARIFDDHVIPDQFPPPLGTAGYLRINQIERWKCNCSRCPCLVRSLCTPFHVAPCLRSALVPEGVLTMSE